jgi:hypothetical protein
MEPEVDDSLGHDEPTIRSKVSDPSAEMLRTLSSR